MNEETRQNLIVFTASVIIGVTLSLLISSISQNSSKVTTQEIAEAQKVLLRRASFEEVKGSSNIRAENLREQLSKEFNIVSWSEETKTTNECTPAENNVSGAKGEITVIKSYVNLKPEEAQKAKETVALAVRNGYGGQSLTTPNTLTIKSERSGEIHLNTGPLSVTVTTDCYLPQERKDQIWEELINP